MHVVRLLSPKLENETHTKDIDFSPAGINNRWEAGHADTKRALERIRLNPDRIQRRRSSLHIPPA